MKASGRGADEGLTLIELMVAMTLLSVLGAVMLLGVQNNHQLHRETVDESFGLADVRTVVERLGRDVRSARSLYPGATESQLVLWVDKNSDYLPTPDEIITWQLVKENEDGVQYNVIRSTEGGDTVVQARTVVSDIAFCYWTQSADPTLGDCTGSLPAQASNGGLSAEDAAETRLVTTTTTYDFNPTGGVDTRQVSFSSRLRNVE
ncbi:MAG: prepilin-type N-terminal cleavage/methylation domain-containing protein [Actinobacteria bacterium]|nr:prepilin-type N-terminal cleavage/methylation domain-containing protein [Actinomycetota bacterium]MCB9412574.1 prepilin-type N-terminal cleavage/methylation domain-containing protein [Actinomycetota bacterium]